MKKLFLQGIDDFMSFLLVERTSYLSRFTSCVRVLPSYDVDEKLVLLFEKLQPMSFFFFVSFFCFIFHF